MTENDIKGIIEDTLNIPVFLGQESITYPAATLEITVVSPSLFGDGKAERRMYDAYINIWYEEKATKDTAVDALMYALDHMDGITAPDIESYYDTTAKKYRGLFHFYILKDYPAPEPEPEPEPTPDPDPEPEPSPDPEPDPEPTEP